MIQQFVPASISASTEAVHRLQAHQCRRFKHLHQPLHHHRHHHRITSTLQVRLQHHHRRPCKTPRRTISNHPLLQPHLQLQSMAARLETVVSIICEWDNLRSILTVSQNTATRNAHTAMESPSASGSALDEPSNDLRKRNRKELKCLRRGPR
jgi:hypothetical protein